VIGVVYRNTVLLSAANYLGAAFNMLSMVLLARHLPVEHYGALNAALVAAFLAFQVVELGVAQIFTKRLAEHDRQPPEAFHEVFSLRLVLGLLVLLLLVVGGPLVGATPDAGLLLSLIGFAVLFDFLSDVSFAVLRARQAMGYESFANLLKSGIVFGGAVAWVALPRLEDLTPGLVGLLFASGALAKWLFTLRVLGVRPTVVFGEAARRGWTSLLIESTPIGLSTLLSQVMLRAAPLLILFFRGGREVGVYSPSYLIFSGMQIAWTAFLLSLFPHMARTHARSPGAIWTTSSRAFRQILLGTGALGAGVWLFRRPVVLLLFGQEYIETLRVLPLLLVANTLLAMTSLCGGVLTVLGAGRQIAKAYAAALVVSLSLDVVLIPRIGFVGAGVAAVVGQVALLGLLVLFMARERSGRSPSTPVLTPA
jgi:O-antigen/teichoic acid export membrane protein